MFRFREATCEAHAAIDWLVTSYAAREVTDDAHAGTPTLDWRCRHITRSSATAQGTGAHTRVDFPLHRRDRLRRSWDHAGADRARTGSEARDAHASRCHRSAHL